MTESTVLAGCEPVRRRDRCAQEKTAAGGRRCQSIGPLALLLVFAAASVSGQLGQASSSISGGMDDNVGWALATADFDDDGFEDLVVGAPGDDSWKSCSISSSWTPPTEIALAR